MPAVANLVEGPRCGKDDADDGDCNSDDLVKKPLVSGVYDDMLIPRVSVSIDILVSITLDIDFGDCD